MRGARAVRRLLMACKDETERRKYLPQYCAIADEIERLPDPQQAAENIYIILYRRAKEREAAEHGEQ